MWKSRTAILGSVVGCVAAVAVAGGWLAEQSAFVVTTDARVRARMVTISAELASSILAMPAEAGLRIKPGDILVRLDDQKARLALGEVALELKALEIGIARERLSAALARARGTARVASHGASLERADAAIAAARAVLTRSEADHRRAAKLHEAGLIAQAGMDKADEALAVARNAVSQAEATLAESRAELGAAEAEQREADVVTRNAESLAASAHALRQRMALLKVELEQHVIRSPLNGVIDEVFAEPGEHVAPGARLALAHDDQAMWLEAHIKETDLPRIAVGAAVDIHLDAARGECGGRVEQIGAAAMAEFALIPNANPAGVFTKITQRVPVRIRMDADCRGARPGAMASLRIRAS